MGVLVYPLMMLLTGKRADKRISENLPEEVGLSYSSRHETTILLIIGLSSFSYNFVGEPPPMPLK